MPFFLSSHQGASPSAWLTVWKQKAQCFWVEMPSHAHVQILFQNIMQVRQVLQKLYISSINQKSLYQV